MNVGSDEYWEQEAAEIKALLLKRRMVRCSILVSHQTEVIKQLRLELAGKAPADGAEETDE